MSTVTTTEFTVTVEPARSSRRSYFLRGLMLTLGGLAALLLPTAVGIGIQLVLGAILLVGGVALGVSAIWESRNGLAVASAVLSAVFGVMLLSSPMIGLLAMTVFLGLACAVYGAATLSAGVNLWPGKGAGWLVVSGVAGLSVAVALIVLWPLTSSVVGVVVGLYLLALGVGNLVIAFQRDRQG